MAKWNAALARASAVAAAAATVGGLLGCSSSSSNAGPGDAANLGSLPPLGIAEPTCDSTNCPLPAACGGTLLGPSTGVSFCTLSCTDSTGCPSGTVCDFKHTHLGDCLKSCTADTDCSGGFACSPGKASNGAAQKVCWSPYTGADAIPDASTSTGDAGIGADTGSGSDAGASEAGSSTDSGGSDAGSDTSSGSGNDGGAEAGAD